MLEPADARHVSNTFTVSFLLFFKSPSLTGMKSLSEVTLGHGNHLEALLDFCLMSISGVLQHVALYILLVS